MKYNKVLTIAGSDSGGGAGIQADIKTISACGCFATSAITAITAQNTIGVSDIHAIPNETLRKQITAVLDDIGTDAVKIGMLHSSDTVRIVSELLQKYNIKNVVLDTVMVATSGDTLLKKEAIETLKSTLIPNVRVITPNIPEAELLLNKKITRQPDLLECAKALSNNRQVSVLLKAGHLDGDKLTDIFYNAESDEIVELNSNRVITKNTHGTGCTLSAAFASYLAKGLTLNDSAKAAKEYINNSIVEGAEYEIGSGHGPVHHFHKYWK